MPRIDEHETDVNFEEQPESSEAVEEPSEEEPESSEPEGDNEGSNEPEVKHEHSVPYERFKEVNQKNKELEQKLRQFQEAQEQNKPQKQQDQAEREYLKALEEANPQFAKDYKTMLEGYQKLQKQLEGFEQSAQEREMAQIQREATDRLSKLYKENNVPEDLQNLYATQVRQAAMEGKIDSWEDLEATFHNVHKTLSSYLDNQKREALKSYAKGKKADSVPTNRSSSEPSKGKQSEVEPQDPEERLAAIAKSATRKWRQDQQN